MSIDNDDVEPGFDEDESNFDENESEIIDDNSVNSDDEISVPQKKNRGKGLNWSEPLSDSSGSIITYINYDKIVEDAKNSFQRRVAKATIFIIRNVKSANVNFYSNIVEQ
jgi:hypothetical protein